MKSSVVVAGISAIVVCAVPQRAATQAGKGGKGGAEVATLVTLPALGSNAEALGINAAGTVIVGQAFDRSDFLHAVKWTLQGGTWVIESLLYPGPAASARALDGDGNVAGYDASSTRYPVLWSIAGGYQVLGCDGTGGLIYGAYALSDAAQVIVGQDRGRAAAWSAPGYCTQILPALYPEGGGSANATDGAGMVIGGRAAPGPKQASVPVRWVNVGSEWQLQQLDARSGDVFGANASGDLAGSVRVPCALAEGCHRGMIWYAAGGSRQLSTLGGEHSWIRDINNQGEAVGLSTWRTVNTAFIWSEARGMLQLPVASWGAAYAVSDVRPDGTRIVAGTNSRADAVIWIVRSQ